jgi:hypothetical protein
VALYNRLADQLWTAAVEGDRARAHLISVLDTLTADESS